MVCSTSCLGYPLRGDEGSFEVVNFILELCWVADSLGATS